MKHKLLTCIAAAAAVQFVTAAPILWDITVDSDYSTNADVADFTAAGVSEDLTGASVSTVLGAVSGTMTADNGVTLSFADGESAKGTYANENEMTGAGAALICDYINTKNNGPLTMTIGGLSSQLEADTTYSFYLWGIGDSEDQNSTFTFGGTEITVGSADPDNADASDYMAEFTFTTESTVSDTLEFIWDDSNERSALNGFAIVAVPEPATFGLFAAVGGAVLFIRRRFMI